MHSNTLSVKRVFLSSVPPTHLCQHVITRHLLANPPSLSDDVIYEQPLIDVTDFTNSMSATTNQPTHPYDYWISINFENGCNEWIIVSFENVYWKWKTVVVWQARRKFNFPILQTFITIKLSLASPVNYIKCISFLLERIIICQNISICLDSDFKIYHGVKLKSISACIIESWT